MNAGPRDLHQRATLPPQYCICSHPLPPASLVGLVDLALQHLDVALDLLDVLVDGGHLQLVLVVVRLRLRLRTRQVMAGQAAKNGRRRGKRGEDERATKWTDQVRSGRDKRTPGRRQPEAEKATQP